MRVQFRGYLSGEMKDFFGGVYSEWDRKELTNRATGINDIINHQLFGTMVGYAFMDKKRFTTEILIGYGEVEMCGLVCLKD